MFKGFIYVSLKNKNFHILSISSKEYVLILDFLFQYIIEKLKNLSANESFS